MTSHAAGTDLSGAGDRFPEISPELQNDLVQTFKLLADETRLKILVFLTQDSELHVTAMCERLGQSQPAVSHHLALLRIGGLIDVRREGKHNYYHIQTVHFARLAGRLLDGGMNGQGPTAFQLGNVSISRTASAADA